MWTCPECGRKFSRNKQSHSCIQYDPEDLFIGKSDIARDLCFILIGKVKEFGDVEVRAGKWGLSVRHLTTFLSIMIEKHHLALGFISADRIDEFPVYQSLPYVNHRFSNSIKIESADEIDDQLIKWLKQAWDLAV